jgi:hypothetical protein
LIRKREPDDRSTRACRLTFSAGSILTARRFTLPEKSVRAICERRTSSGSSTNYDARRKPRSRPPGSQFQHANCRATGTADTCASASSGGRCHSVFDVLRITHTVAERWINDFIILEAIDC